MPEIVTTHPNGLHAMIRFDSLMLKPSARLYGLFILLGAALAVAGSWDVALPFLSITGVITATTLMSNLENGAVAQLCGVLPVSRSTVVASHYLVTLAGWATSLALGLLALGLRRLLGWQPGADIATLVTTFGLVLVPIAVIMFTYATWGTSKGTVVLLLCMGLIACAGGLLANAADLDLRWIATLDGPTLVAGTLALGAVCLLISCWASCATYRRRDL